MKLTDKNVEGLKLPKGVTEMLVYDDRLPGFGIRRGKKRATWIMQASVRDENGKPVSRRRKLGTWPNLNAEDAFDMARTMLRAIADGLDPDAAFTTKKAIDETARLTLGNVIDDYLLTKKRKGLKPRSLQALERYLKGDEYAGRLNALLLTDISKPVVRTFLKEMAKKYEGQPFVYEGLRASLKALFTFACSEYDLDIHPMAGSKRDMTVKKRSTYLDDGQIRAIWLAANEHPCKPYGRLVKCLLLTGCRRQELGALQLRMIDRQKKVVRWSGEDLKNGLERVMPVSDRVLALMLESGASPYVFSQATEQTKNGARPGARPFQDWTPQFKKLKELAAVHYGEAFDFILHDFRRAISTRIRETLRTPHHVAELMVGHVQSGVSVHYALGDLLDQQRDAYEAYENIIMEIVGETPPADNIHKLRRA